MVKPLWTTIWQFLLKLNTRLSEDLVIPVLSVYPREKKTCVNTMAYTLTVIAALYIIIKKMETQRSIHR